VTLEGSKPPIWRRLQVPGDTTLGELHDIIQIAMGWTDSHLHQFIVGGSYFGLPDPDWDDMRDMKDERRFRLDQIVAKEGDKFRYEYDFGDGWLHQVLVEKIVPPDPEQVYPLCVKGRRACPPEDVGGVWGYEEFLVAIRDPKHPEHEEYRGWIGGPFDPEAFDLEETNDWLLDWAEGGSIAGEMWDAEDAEEEGVAIATSVGRFVYYPDEAPFAQFYLFRPYQERFLLELAEKLEAGEEIDATMLEPLEAAAMLMLSITPAGFYGHLFLKRKTVGEDEVEAMVDGTSELLDQLQVGLEGGTLSVYWVEEIALYEFEAGL
jgi:hypothetical protein